MESAGGIKSGRRRRRVAPLRQASQLDAFTLADTAAARPVFAFIDDDAIARLTARAFDLLEGHGVVVVHPKGAETLKLAGATPGRDGNRLRLPRRMVEAALAATPKDVTLCGKLPARDIHLPRADGGFIMRTGTGAHGFVDPETGAYRNLVLDDVATIAKVANGLDEVGFVAHPFVFGVPELTSDIHGFAALIARTDKHVWIQPYNKENIEYLMRLAVIAAGGEAELRARPLASCIVCSFSPLEFKVMDVEAIIQAGRHGLPVHACSLPSAGGTAPITLPGLVLMATAEILAMVVMTHVLAPGTPVIATPLMFTLDMRTGSALQRALLGQAVSLSGADILGGVGQLECATVFSPVQAVLDNELGAMQRRYLRAPEVSDQSMNWQEVPAISPGGHFLDSEQTLKHCRDQFVPRAFLRQGRDDYEASDRRTAFDQAREICLDLLGRPLPEGLPGEHAQREMADVVAAADRHILASAAAHIGPVPNI